MSKKLVLHVALASMILGIGAPVSAMEDPTIKTKKSDDKDTTFFGKNKEQIDLAKHCVLAPLFIGLGISAYALSYVHGVSNPEIKGEWKRLLKLNQLLSDRKGYWQNAKDVFWTKWIGQSFKDKELKANTKTGKIKQSRLKPPTGFMGWLNTYVYTGKKAAGLLTTLGGTYLFLTHPDIISTTVGPHLQKKFGFEEKEPTEKDLLDFKNSKKLAKIYDAKLAKIAKKDEGK